MPRAVSVSPESQAIASARAVSLATMRTIFAVEAACEALSVKVGSIPRRYGSRCGLSALCAATTTSHSP